MFKKILPDFILKPMIFVYRNFLGGYAKRSYSQEGEDLLLNRFFSSKKKGFYIDVGAHHPKRFSNTFLFYKKGWHGINIDAMPGSMKLFNKMRQRDTNLELAISDIREELTYYIFNEPALNGFSKELSVKRSERKKYFIQEELKVTTTRLEDVLFKYIPNNQKIDFLSIDVEGLDMKVLKSLNLNKYRPSFILIETLGSDIESILCSDTVTFLADYYYKMVSKLANTSIFIDSNEYNKFIRK